MFVSNYCLSIAGLKVLIRASNEQEMCESCHDLPELVQALKNARMFKAVSDKHLDCLKAAIDTGADVNEYDEPTGERKRILNMVELEEYIGDLDKVVQSDDDINNPPQKTAIVLAAQAGWSEGVELLIQSGADVNKSDTLGFTPLIVAAESGKDELLDMLIQAGADVNVKKRHYRYGDWIMPYKKRRMIGRTALMHAANGGNVRCVELLLKAGADVNIVHEIIDEEINLAAVNYAVSSGGKEVFELLIDAGADVNQCYFSLSHASLEKFQELLCAGIKINQMDRNGENALDYCVWIKDEKLRKLKIKLLNAAGETPSARTRAWAPGLLESFTPQLKYETDVLNLMSICRKFIREHLLQMSQVNLFYRVPRLGLPAALCNYLLYNVDLNEPTEDEQ